MVVNVIMPMLGKGERMRGIQNTCKPLMVLPDGERFFMKALKSLQNYEIYGLFLVVLEEYLSEFIDLISEIKDLTKAKTIHIIGHEPTASPVETLSIGLEKVWRINRRNLPLFCLDCDIYGIIPTFTHSVAEVGRLFWFESDNPNKCYICLYPNSDTVYDIREKKVVSNNAVFGAYLFEDVLLLRFCLKWKILEFKYISDIFKHMLKERRLTIKASPMPSVINFGTVEELEQYDK